jgi:hypothetical protein
MKGKRPMPDATEALIAVSAAVREIAPALAAKIQRRAREIMKDQQP